MKKSFLFFICIFFIQSIFGLDLNDNNLKSLTYGITKKEVISLFGEPTEIEKENIELLIYQKDNVKYYFNFFTDDNLSSIWKIDDENNNVILLPTKHSFFLNQTKKGKYSLSPKDSEINLLKNNYVQKYFYFYLLDKELKFYENKKISINEIKYYGFKEDRIVYTFYFINGQSNKTVCAYIIGDKKVSSEESSKVEIGFIKYDKNNDGIIEDLEGDYFNACYYLDVSQSSNIKTKKIILNSNDNNKEYTVFY